MRKLQFVFALVVLSLMASQPVFTQGPENASSNPMSFFVTSVGSGKGGDLGGLAGADALCQRLAAASFAPGAGKRTWHAYLSTQGPGAVNARDRIGQGPWYNFRGNRVAQNLADLHGDTAELARLSNNVDLFTATNERGSVIAGGMPRGSQHDMLTGSKTDGTAYKDSADHTCHNWTSSGEGSAQVGHHDRTGGGNTSWNSSHASPGCSLNALSAEGAGLFYCFAIN
jgi:hypothetical protein